MTFNIPILKLFFVTTVSLLFLTAPSNHAQNRKQSRLELVAKSQDGKIQGTWKSEGQIWLKGGKKDEWIQIQLELQGDEKLYFGRSYREFEALEGEKDKVQFLLPAPAGDFEFSGDRRRPKAGGDFVFRPNQEFLEEARKALGSDVAIWDNLRLAIYNISVDYLKGMRTFENDFQLPEIIKMMTFGVAPEYVSALQKQGGRYAADEIVKMRTFGVPADFPAKLSEAGYQFNAEQMVKLRNFGVTPEYAAEWKTSGANYSADDLVKLRNFGVPSSYGPETKSSGINLTVDDLVKLRNFGVTPAYLKELKSVGNYSVEEIIKLKNSGVQPEYIAGWNAAGYKLTVDDLLRLRNAGVPLEYAQASNVAGRKNIDIEALIHLRNKGVSPDIIRRIRQ